jgi:hypothetical protein
MSEPFNWRFAAIADEIDPDLAPALDVMREVGILALELRSAWGKGVLDLDEDELHAVQRETSRRGMIVPVIASPIGKSLITEPIEFELRRLDRALAIAQRLDSWGIRLFSFYLPSGCPPDQYREAILERFQRFVTRAAAAGIVLLHENEKDIYGDIQSAATICSRRSIHRGCEQSGTPPTSSSVEYTLTKEASLFSLPTLLTSISRTRGWLPAKSLPPGRVTGKSRRRWQHWPLPATRGTSRSSRTCSLPGARADSVVALLFYEPTRHCSDCSSSSRQPEKDNRSPRLPRLCPVS